MLRCLFVSKKPLYVSSSSRTTSEPVEPVEPAEPVAAPAADDAGAAGDAGVGDAGAPGDAADVAPGSAGAAAGVVDGDDAAGAPGDAGAAGAAGATESASLVGFSYSFIIPTVSDKNVHTLYLNFLKKESSSAGFGCPLPYGTSRSINFLPRAKAPKPPNMVMPQPKIFEPYCEKNIFVLSQKLGFFVWLPKYPS